MSAETVEAMEALGFTSDQILAVVKKMDELKKSRARSANAERQRRFKARQAEGGVTPKSVTKVTEITPKNVTEVTEITQVTRKNVTEGDVYNEHARAPGFPVGDPNGSPLVSPLPSVGPQGGKKSKPDDPLPVLLECLDEETARALIAHRRAKKAPLTAKAASLLVRQFHAHGNPQEAAEAMIAQGWQGFKPEWMDRARGSPNVTPIRRKNVAHMLKEMLEDEQREREEEINSEAFERLPIVYAER